MIGMIGQSGMIGIIGMIGMIGMNDISGRIVINGVTDKLMKKHEK